MYQSQSQYIIFYWTTYKCCPLKPFELLNLDDLMENEFVRTVKHNVPTTCTKFVKKPNF